MKCPHCVDGVVNLFSSIAECEHCNGNEASNTMPLRYVGSEFVDPKPLPGSIDGSWFTNENELLWSLGPLDDLQITGSGSGGGKFFIDIVTMRQGRATPRVVSGRGCSMAMEEALLNCLFVQSRWYSQARENANIFLECLLRQHSGDWEPIASGQTRRSHSMVLEKYLVVEQVDWYLEDLAITLLISKSIIRGKHSSSEGCYELPHELSYRVERDGFDVRVTTMLNNQSKPKIEVSYFT